MSVLSLSLYMPLSINARVVPYNISTYNIIFTCNTRRVGRSTNARADRSRKAQPQQIYHISVAVKQASNRAYGLANRKRNNTTPEC